MFIHALFLNISVAISAYAYPLVVRLYRLFEWICTFKFLSDDFIHSVWNNIYVFVAVIVLFAIAIKLISAMINPDMLTDNKKGAKAYYFRAVAAVVLIFIIPIVFDYSFKIQEELLTKNMLSSHVFGYEVAEGTNIGQILAWEGFSSFCLPEGASKDQVDNDYLLIRADMDNISSVLNTVKLEGSTKYALTPLLLVGNKTWNYHAFLCPLVGVLLVYEMVLLCMDTLFRAAKLGFLELMLPMVLGAFVFDPNILKKWAKEFFSEYISLFLKVLAMYFIAITISQIQAEISKTDFYSGDWLLAGLFRVILIIALLQLAKKIPDLINKIFGTEIKSRSGIKGRLGEMVGIGGIAQKAWSSLGTGVKNLGKLALTAPAAGGYAAANAVYQKKTGQPLSDHKAVRGLRAAGAGFGAALKNGSWVKGLEAGNKAYDTTNASARDKLKASKSVDEIIYGKDGKNGILTDSSGNSYVNQQNLRAKGTASKKLRDGIQSVAGSTVRAASDSYQNMLEAESFAKTMHKNMTAVIEAGESAAQHLELSGKSEEARRIRAAIEKYKASGKEKEIGTFINNNRDLFDEQVVQNMIGDNGKITALTRQKKYLEQNWNRWGISEVDHMQYTLGEAALGFLAETTLKGKVESKKADYDIAVADARLSEIEKISLDGYFSAETAITNSKAFAVGRKYDENKYVTDAVPIKYQPIEQGEPTIIQQNTQTVVQQSAPAEQPTSTTSQTIINNNYNNNTAGTGSDKVSETTVKVDTKDFEEAVDKMDKNVTSAIENEGKATRDAIDRQGTNIKNATDSVKGTIENLEDQNNKNGKDEE